jgi:hypothetical protein
MNTSQSLLSQDNREVPPSGQAQLLAALDSGAGAFRQQLRLLLALCQVNSNKPTRTPYTEKPLTIRQARLTVLTGIPEILGEEGVQTLFKEVVQIGDATVRLPLLAKLAIRMPASQYRTIVRDMWNQTKAIVDPAARAHTLFEIAPLLALLNDEPATPSALLQVLGIAQSIKNTEARLRSLIALVPHLPLEVATRTVRRVLIDLQDSKNDALSARSLMALAPTLPPDVEDEVLKVTENIKTPVERARALTALARYLSETLQGRLRHSALDAIMLIEGEEERAETLVAFAPNLEYVHQGEAFPKVLEKALTIGITITRRHIRAKVLVALAPHLTTDLQGEALAAVHSLSNERDRAMLLAELAPQLPGNMLVASLAVAHTMREQDSRVHALSVLAHYVPENARMQTILDALAAASNLPHHFERVGALVALVDILPPHLLEQALTNALETARLIDNENARARAIALLGSHLPERLLLRALDITLELENTQQRLNALQSLLPALTGEKALEALQQALQCARQMPLEYKRARALISIAPHLKPDMLAEVHTLADTLDDPLDKAHVYIAVAQNLPPEQRPPLIARAWTLLRQIEDGYDRATLVAALAPFLPAPARTDMTVAIINAIQAVAEDYDKASAITILAPLLVDETSGSDMTMPDAYAAIKKGLEAALSIPQQGIRTQLLMQGAALWGGTGDKDRSYGLWKHLAHALMTLPLPDVLMCLGALLPIIRDFADESGLQDVALVLGIRPR